MIEFNLKDTYAGWVAVSIPDNMVIEVRVPSTTHEMHASLQELLELYGRMYHEQEGTTVIETGKYIELEEKERNHLRFRKPPLDVRTSFDELREALESLLAEAFRAHDQKDDEDCRAEKIEVVRKRLRKRDIDFNVQALYDRLTSETDL